MTKNTKKYLSFPQKMGYGCGDLGSNAFYSFVAAFVMIYLTDTMGMNAGIVGTLMLISKLLDGITDVIFGNLIDNTHSKMGKARPWLLYSSFVLAALEIMMFAIPGGFSTTSKYVYFFVIYTAANALAYTANNISYATLTALITRNPSERVQLGTYRYGFALVASTVIQSISIGMVKFFGGGASGWRMTAIVMSVVQILCNVIVVFSVKELPEETENIENDISEIEKISFKKVLSILIHNKYYLSLLVAYVVNTLGGTMFQTMGIYYCTYVLKNPALLGILSLTMFAMVIGLFFNPILVKKYGLYKVVLIGMILSAVFAIIVIPFGFAGAFVPILICLALKYIFSATLTGSLNALIAEVATFIKRKERVSVEGTLYSCSSVGLKVGGGVATALSGWMLEWGGYDGSVTEQLGSVISMINIGYFVLPAIAAVIVVLCVRILDVSEKNTEYEKSIQG